jgi:sterol desaturase/sphingolipid hydroxylase (fatty acid hydroxylase superfamily)
MPLKNCLLITCPVFLVLTVWGLLVGPFGSTLIPIAALLSWCFFYTYLWTLIHRAIHGIEANWFRRLGPIFRFFRDHHLKHHASAGTNFGTVFPWTDYVFFTFKERKVSRAANDKGRSQAKSPAGFEK